MPPISLEEVQKLPTERPKTGLVDWEAIINQIVESGQYYSAKEVTDTFVAGKVKSFRTKAVLDQAVVDGLLEKFWSEKRYVYGKPLGPQ